MVDLITTLSSKELYQLKYNDIIKPIIDFEDEFMLSYMSG